MTTFTPPSLALAPSPTQLTPALQPTVAVPLDILEKLSDAAERAAINHHHKTADTWPDGTPCNICAPRTAARGLLDWARA